MYKANDLILASLVFLATAWLPGCVLGGGAEDNAEAAAETSAEDDERGPQRVLLVVSNHGLLGDTGMKTGVWMAELTHPYWQLADADLDLELDIASPDGGDAPIDGFSVPFNFADFLATGDPTTGDPANLRFLESPETADWIDSTIVTLENEDGTSSEVTEYRFVNTLRLGEIAAADYDAIYFAGGNGAMWQLPDDPDVHAQVRDFYESGKIVAAACHGAAALLNTTLSDGSYLVAGKRVTGFSNAEEEYLGQAEIMPLLLQDEFVERGAEYIEADTVWGDNVVVDGRMISAQNPPSAEIIGTAIIEALAASLD